MTPKLRTIVVIVVLLVAAGLLWLAADRLWLGPVRQRRDQLAALHLQTTQFSAAQRSITNDLAERTDAIATTLLPPDLDALQHALRAGVTDIAQHAALAEVVVSSGNPTPASSPLLKARMRTKALTSTLRSRPDFALVRGRLSGAGSLEQVLDALALIASQPWLHRVEGFTIEPAGSERRRFKLTADFATLHLPDLARGPNAPTPITEPPQHQRDRIARILAANPFAAYQPPTTPDKPGKNPGQTRRELWRLVAIATADQPEAWFIHTKSHKRLVLTPGSSVAGFELIHAAGERAVLRRGDADFTIQLGQSLADIAPIEEEVP